MTYVKKHIEKSALSKLQEIIDEATGTNTDSVEIEYAKEGGLEVTFMSGNIGFGGILVNRELESAVMSLIHERSGMKNTASGLLHWESRGKNFEILVEEYDNFGETAFKLKFQKL